MCNSIDRGCRQAHLYHQVQQRACNHELGLQRNQAVDGHPCLRQAGDARDCPRLGYALRPVGVLAISSVRCRADRCAALGCLHQSGWAAVSYIWPASLPTKTAAGLQPEPEHVVGRTSSRSHLPAISEPPQATVSIMMVDPASVPTPTATCSTRFRVFSPPC